MIMRELVERFERKAPAAVMVRAMLENVFAAERLDGIFAEHGHSQTTGRLLFSTLAEIMGLVAARIQPSVHAAYQAKLGEIGVTAKAVYDKLQRVNGDVSQAVLRRTAESLGAVVDSMAGGAQELLPNYRVKILDGNHLRRTERRLGVLRERNSAPLPGHALVVLDPQSRLITDVFPCEDAHAQERSLLPAVLETVQRDDVWVADRNFCTTDFLLGIHRRGAFFIIRQHGASLRGELTGKRTRVGRCETGVLYEQRMQLLDADGMATNVRRVSIVLDEPTGDGDAEIHILTNLPKRMVAAKVAELYRKRWTIEAAFNEVAKSLEGEIVTLGYPKAALFAFCCALIVHNLLSVIKVALASVHGHDTVEQSVSTYYLADEVARTYEGMMIATGETYWTKTYHDLSPRLLARDLVRIARLLDLTRYRKHKRGPKKPQAIMCKKGRQHVATARLLASK